MASKRDVRSNFSAKENESKSSIISIPEIIITVTDNASQAEASMAKEEVKKKAVKRRRYQNVSEKVREQVRRYALIHGTKAAVDKYPKFPPSTT